MRKVAKATALRELLGEAADPAVSEVCRALLSAVDVEAPGGGDARDGAVAERGTIP